MAFESGAVDSEIGFSLVLNLFDSTITYRSRYLQRRDANALLELLALNPDNPRSLAWISQTLASRIAKMEDTPKGVLPTMLATFNLPHHWKSDAIAKLAQANDPAAIAELLHGATHDAWAISDALSQRYFSHAEGNVQAVGA